MTQVAEDADWDWDNFSLDNIVNTVNNEVSKSLNVLNHKVEEVKKDVSKIVNEKYHEYSAQFQKEAEETLKNV